MQTILGVFTERQDADNAILELEKHYFDPKDISIIAKNKEERVDHNSVTKEENIAVGAVDGAAAGGLLGGLTGALIGAGILTIPGIGAILIGGPIAVALGFTGTAALALSAATTGAVAGGVIGALAGLGLPTEDRKVYERYIHEGAILLALQAMNLKEADDITSIFEKHNATQIRKLGNYIENRDVIHK